MTKRGITEQEMAWAFLLKQYKSQELFTKEELNAEVGWGTNINTYWSKKIKTLLIEQKKNRYRVSESFRRLLDLEAFKKHISQTTRVSTNYKTFSHRNVVQFEFFLPLANEIFLRSVLDNLFYKDSILSRLKTFEIEKLQTKIPQTEGEITKDYLDRICNWISDRFIGYSIYHVNGRYRASDLKTHKEALQLQKDTGKDYLIDETTAIVKFIFPCAGAEEGLFLNSNDYFDKLLDESESDSAQKDATLIRWFFYILFVQSIVEIVNGEDEIWLLETGFKSRLHIWRME